MSVCVCLFFQIQLSFLLVGHTHEDIDQRFSTFAEMLRNKGVFGPQDMTKVLPCAEDVSGLYDFKSWLEPHLADVKYHTTTGMFRFRKHSSRGGRVHIFYRKLSTTPWKVMKNGIFNNLQDGKPDYPTGSPKLLMPSYTKDKIDTDQLRKSLPVWTKYFPPEATQAPDDWKKWITQIEKLSEGGEYLQKHAKGHEKITLASFKKYRLSDVPNSGEHLKEQTELDSLSITEIANPTVSTSSGCSILIMILEIFTRTHFIKPYEH